MTEPKLMIADEITDLYAPFTPDEFISIGFGAGHIGRFYWDNQRTITLEAWGRDSSYERWSSEVPGSCALISVMGDWWAWLWT